MAPPLLGRVASSAEQAASKDLQESNEKLCSAAEQGELEEVDRLLKQGAKPDGFKNERGFTPLIAVCANGNTGTSDCDGVDHFDCLDRLLEAGADVNQTTKVSFPFPFSRIPLSIPLAESIIFFPVSLTDRIHVFDWQ